MKTDNETEKTVEKAPEKKERSKSWEKFLARMGNASLAAFIYFCLFSPDGGGLLFTGFLIALTGLLRFEGRWPRIFFSVACVYWIVQIGLVIATGSAFRPFG